MDRRPDFESFASRYERGEAQVVATSLVADLETPVSAMLKLAEGRPYSFLLESVTGGSFGLPGTGLLPNCDAAVLDVPSLTAVVSL